MTLDYVDAVTELDGRAFGQSGWSRRYFVGELTESPISVFYVLTDQQDRLLGYFGAWHIVDQLQLCTFAVDPNAQGQGLGAILLHCVFRLAQRLDCELIQLEVRVSNTAARRLYRSRGFSEDAVRSNFYANPREDGVLMSAPTPSSVETSIGPLAADRWPAGLALDWDDRGGRASERWQARR
ncbi:MAG: ribosomal protein S18-alanine N-acetyltransferase [Chloroflexi bacterium]|nr:ribosomal protein S18-alanine N-acetyltransferase [Chloroflexota bacterium]